MSQQRELATTLRDVIFRLSNMDESIAASLREGLSPAEMCFANRWQRRGGKQCRSEIIAKGVQKGMAV
jgi:hypothetical protein